MIETAGKMDLFLFSQSLKDPVIRFNTAKKFRCHMKIICDFCQTVLGQFFSFSNFRDCAR